MKESDIIIEWPPPWFCENAAIYTVYVAAVVTFCAACVLLQKRQLETATGVLSTSLLFVQISFLQHILDASITCGCGGLAHQWQVLIGYGRDYVGFLVVIALQGATFCVAAYITRNRCGKIEVRPLIPAIVGFLAATSTFVALSLWGWQYVLERALKN